VRKLGATFVGWWVLVAAGVAWGDEAWRKRVEAEATKAEQACARLDQATAAKGDLPTRVRALDERVTALEKAAGIPPGVVLGKDDLSSLTQDLVNLGARIKRLAQPADAPPKPKPLPKPPPKPEPAEDAVPPGPTGPQWPTTLTFNGTARMSWEEKGEWILRERWDRFGVYEQWNEFRMDGYRGTVHFTLRAAGLLRQIRGAELRVALKMVHPFHAAAKPYRSYEVSWNAQQSLWNGAVRSWLDHDTFEVNVTPRWSTKPKVTNTRLEAVVHVRSVTTKDGQVVRFQVPALPGGE
jgi:hypothetical protein